MTTDALRYVAAALVLVVAGVHWQQYVELLNQVDTVGPLFLLNAAGGAALAVLLLQRDVTLRILGALGAIPLCLGSLISIVLSMGDGIFGYQEPDWRAAVVVAVVAEVAALPVLLAYLARTYTARQWDGAR
ncbi:MAG TPA: hypothetical protein VFY44_06330 [Thermoleophilaceae bacterium]|nr:hypothetical protein [Thermoleophilaceae bacterium]